MKSSENTIGGDLTSYAYVTTAGLKRGVVAGLSD